MKKNRDGSLKPNPFYNDSLNRSFLYASLFRNASFSIACVSRSQDSVKISMKDFRMYF